MARLAEFGLVAVSQRGSRHLYEAHDPVILRRLLERQLEEAAGVIPHLQALQAEDRRPARIRIYGGDRAADVFHQALASKSKQLLEIVSAKDLQEILGEKFHFTRRRLKNGVRLRSLRVEKYEIKKYSKEAHARELRESKFLPRELSFRASLMCWDDTVAFFSSKDEGLAWTVESRSLAETVRQTFELLWSISRTMETA